MTASTSQFISCREANFCHIPARPAPSDQKHPLELVVPQTFPSRLPSMPAQRLFHICTIANKIADYREMRDSFSAAGFNDQLTRFTLLDNTERNRFDPFQIIGEVVAKAEERYVVFCHQDVRLNQGQDAGDFARILGELDERDPHWLIAGNAGFDFHGNPVLHLNDPGGDYRDLCLPRKVISLDENFLVLKARSGLKTSAELSGFHLYGTDLCLNAYKRGGSAYVVSFLVEHLSRGDFCSADYARVLNDFKSCWRKQVVVGLIRTTGTQILLSSVRMMESLLPKYETIAQFLWDVRMPLIFRPVHQPKVVAEALVLGVIVGSLMWRVALRWVFAFLTSCVCRKPLAA